MLGQTCRHTQLHLKGTYWRNAHLTRQPPTPSSSLSRSVCEHVFSLQLRVRSLLSIWSYSMREFHIQFVNAIREFSKWSTKSMQVTRTTSIDYDVAVVVGAVFRYGESWTRCGDQYTHTHTNIQFIKVSHNLSQNNSLISMIYSSCVFGLTPRWNETFLVWVLCVRHPPPDAHKPTK